MYKNTILFVDDTKFVLRILDRMLKDEEYNKIYVNNARDALKILEETEVDVIITDILMPEINGLQLLKIAKEKYPKICRVALSGCYNSACIIDAINKCEVYRYLTKPLKLTDNYKTILKDILKHAEYLKSIN
ncbi:MAG: response regulator [Clostridium sp.]|jgi:DNA-binding NtrC family response regulator|uniref:response regulator n=1 Tax=Clostridium sp. TaxID=1506 RepID=UPI0025BBB76A|nr:response regulator [Clostridium sp.]MCH3963470.1 response regulator [Clostridium sp.]MCI1714611.1 response regulator [Clostridium sp.]MCI1799200.1 response regulator [Clostridium sp.]MCI1812794.1 response regulator [Clostridium sp.]MCI1869684.1 response regulator [Clostridium sp.]